MATRKRNGIKRAYICVDCNFTDTCFLLKKKRLEKCPYCGGERWGMISIKTAIDRLRESLKKAEGKFVKVLFNGDAP